MATQQQINTVAPQDPAAAAKSRFWQRYFSFYDRLNDAIPYQRMVEYHTKGLEPKPSDRILDAGTGTGNVAVGLLGAGATVVGIDFCIPAIDICYRKAPNGDFRFGDLTKRLEFEPESFDKISCCCVLHLLERPAQEAALLEFFRVLKPGGLLTLTVFAEGFNSLKVYRETLAEHRRAHGLVKAASFACRYSWDTARFLYYVRKIRRQEKMGDYKFFSLPALVSTIEKAGFGVEDQRMIFAGQSVAARARKPVRS